MIVIVLPLVLTVATFVFDDLTVNGVIPLPIVTVAVAFGAISTFAGLSFNVLTGSSSSLSHEANVIAEILITAIIITFKILNFFIFTFCFLFVYYCCSFLSAHLYNTDVLKTLPAEANFFLSIKKQDRQPKVWC